MKNILITGASGFIGGSFLNSYSKTFDIKALSLQKGLPQNEVFKGRDVIIHCAGLAHQMQGAPENEYMRINAKITYDFAKQAKENKVRQFIFLSTAHVYGDSGDLKDHQRTYHESSPMRASDPYGLSKIKAENLLTSLQDENFNVSIVRPPMVYGKGGKGNLSSLVRLIKIFPILPFGYDKNRRSLIYIENLTYFLSLLVQKNEKGIFLPQDPEPVSIALLTELIAKSLGRKVFLFKFPSFIQKLIEYIFSKQALRLFGTLQLDGRQSWDRLGYQPSFTTEEGLKKSFS